MNLQSHKITKFYCGTSNIVLPVVNKTLFPIEFQNKTRLTYYSSIFNTVEINSTFYKLPMPRTVEKWATEVPDDFRFTFKIWKEITHGKELIYNPDDIKKFLSIVDMAGNKKACLLMQFPASIKASYYQKLRTLLDSFFETNMMEGWHLAIEFRDKSWYRDSVYELLEQYDAGIVIHDMPRSFTPVINMNKSFVYLRFHGESGDYKGSYADDLLREHVSGIKDYIDAGLPVFAYYNNTIGDAVQNAMTLNSYFN